MLINGTAGIMSHMFSVTDDGCANGKETQMEESLDAFLLCRLL